MRENIWIVNDLLKLPSTVLIGSKALGVETKYSDTDVCVLEGETTQLIRYAMENAALRTSSNPYAGESLLLNHSRLLEHTGFDVFVFERADKLATVRDVMSIMAYIPKWVLKRKGARVFIFRLLLRVNFF